MRQRRQQGGSVTQLAVADALETTYLILARDALAEERRTKPLEHQRLVLQYSQSKWLAGALYEEQQAYLNWQQDIGERERALREMESITAQARSAEGARLVGIQQGQTERQRAERILENVRRATA